MNQETAVRVLLGEPVFTGIPADRCEEFWPRVEPVLWRAIVRTDGRHTLLTTKHGIQNGEYGLWAAFSDPSLERCLAAVVAQTLHYPSGTKDLELMLCGGDVIPGCLEFVPLIESWGKATGHADVVVNGRRGWARALKGYREQSVILRKRLLA